MSKKIQAVIACGGTGGHLFPGVAVAERLQARGHAATALVSEKKIDRTAMENHPQVPFETLPSVASPRLFSPAVVPFFFRFLDAVKHCRSVIRRLEADVVLGMGGFTSLPALIAGKKEGAQVFLHEANAIPGRANHFGQRYVHTALVGWEAARSSLSKAPQVEVVGTPIRAALADEKRTQAESRAEIGLSSEVPTILVIGGSQGAQGLNRMVIDSLSHLDDTPCQFVHLTGPDGEAEAQSAYGESSIDGTVAAFHHDMGQLYSAADLVIARAGASTLNELAHFGLPAILVPYPHAAGDHQRLNANIFTEAGAALLADEEEVSGRKLGLTIHDLFGGDGTLEKLGASMRGMAVDDSAERIATLMEEACS